MKTQISLKFSIAAAMLLLAGAMGVHANIFKAATPTMSAATDWTTTDGGATTVAPTASTLGEFGITPTAGNLSAMALGGNTSLIGLQFDAGMQGPLTIASGSTLTLAGNVTFIAGAPNVTLNCGLTISAGTETWTTASAGQTLTINGALGLVNGQTLTIAGPGNVTTTQSIGSGSSNDGTITMSLTGTFTGTDINLGRRGSVTTTPTATSPVAASGGFTVTGAGTVNVATIEIATANSGGNGVISAGNTTASGKVTIGQSTSGGSSPSRGAYFQVTGGSFTASDTVNGIVMAPNNGTTHENLGELYVSGGTVTAGKISYGASGDALGGIGWVIVKGTGNLYVGSGGVVRATPQGSYTAGFSLFSGLLGAQASWSSSLPMVLSGAVGTPFIIQAADSGGAQHNITLSGALSSTGSLTKTGGGTLTLSGPNTYTGNTAINAGIVNAGVADNGTTGPFGKPATVVGSLAFGGGTLQYSSANTVDYSGRFSTAGSQPISIDVNGQAVTFATALTGIGTTLALQDSAGGGTLTLSSGANNYTGNTTVSSGTLNVSGAITGTGAVNVNGGTLAGVGSISGTVTVGSGGALAPGSGGTGTLTVNGLTFSAGSHGTFSPGSDSVTVGAGGLTINGGAITFLQPGTSTPFTAPGTYTLANYSGSVGGTGATALTVANPQPHTTYNFIDTGTSIQLQITSTSAIGTWINGTSGNWSTAGNWTGTGTMPPQNPGDTAIFDNGNATSLATVTLDQNETVGTLTMNNPTSFQITPASGQTLTLDNSGAGVNLGVTGGTQNAINAAVSLNDNVTASVNSGDSLTFSSAINNASVPEKLTVSVAGTMVLSAANGYGPSAGAVGTVLSGGGTLQVGSNTSLGNGDVTNTGSSTLQAGAANLNLANNIGIAPSVTTTVNNNGNNLTLGGVISGTGGLTKAGLGTLVLGGNNTYSGNTTVNAGVLSISSSANVANASGIILNGGDLLVSGTTSLANNIGIGAGTATGLIDASGTLTLNGVIATAGSSANNLTINGGTGTGTVVLGGANTFNGTTVIASGTLQLANSLALQNSILNYSSGTLTFGSSITAATIAQLTGSQSLVLNNQAGTPAGVALTTGGNSASWTYGGSLSGFGSLTKSGTGTLTLTGNNSYTNTTTVNAGTLELPAGGVINGGPANANGGELEVDGGSLTATTGSILGTLLVSSGSASYSGSLSSGAAQTTYFFDITGGFLSAGSLTVQRVNESYTSQPGSGSTTDGIYINGGTVNVTNAISMTTDGSSASLRIDSGSLTVGGALTIGDSSSTRWAVVDVNGGTLTSTDPTTGIDIGGVASGDGLLLVRAGTATANKLTFGVSGNTSSSVLNITGGSVYVGSGGMVQASGYSVTPTITLGGTGILGATANWSSSMAMTLAGASIQTSDANNVPQNITLSGVLGGTGALTKTGGGTLTLSSAGNTYSGLTTINAGTLNINSEYALGGANYSGLTFGGGTLQYAATLLNGTTDISTKPVTFTGNATIDVNGNSINFANPIGNSGTGGLTVKSTVANGILALAGADTYTGNTTVSSGTLLANNTSGSATGLGGVTVATGAVLGGTGTIGGATTLQSGAVLAAGNGGIGTLTLNTNLTLNALSTNTFAVTPANGVSNTVVVAGVLTPNNSVISITSGAALQPGNTYTLFTYNTTYPVSGSFNPTPVFDVAPAQRGYISNDTVNGHIDLVIAPVTTPLSGASFTMNVTLGIPSTVQVVGGKYPATDANGDPLSIASVTGETNGTVTYTATNITYTATNTDVSATNDSFSYTVTDGFGNTSTPGTVSVIIANTAPTSNPPNVVNQGMSGGNETMEFLGIPGFKYALDETHYLTPPVTWTPVVTNTAASDGTMHFTNTVSGIGDGDYYRTRYVP